MIPVLYPSTETAFTTNGLGGLPDAINCVVTEQRNTQGGYFLEMDYPVDGLHYADIAPDRIIYAAPSMGNTPQPFRISRINRPIDGIVHIEAPHISAELQKLTSWGIDTGTNIQGMIYNQFYRARQLGQTVPFWCETDITVQNSVTFSHPEPTSLADILLGAEGSVLDVVGGEYEFDKYHIILHQQRGVDSGLEIRYGVNMSDLEAETDATELVTAVIPFWKGQVNEQDVVVMGDMCTADNASAYAYVRCVPLDVSQQFELEQDQQPTKAQVTAKGTAFINSTSRKLLQTSIRVGYEPTTSGIGERLINLCDTVRVVYPDLNVSSISKVVETKFNTLTEQYDELTIGSIRNNIVDTIAGLISGGTITGGGGSSGGSGGSSAVTSVNGKTGAVLLNAADVGAVSQTGNAYRTASIPFAQVDSTSTSTAFTATVPGITELRSGVCVFLMNGVVTSESGFTVNVNNLGAKPVYSTLAAATRATTLFNVNYTLLLVYNEERVSGGCWDAYYGYDSNTNTIGYQLRTNSTTMPTLDKFYRYRLLFTAADGKHYVPANTSSSTNATATRTVNQRPIDPFGAIFYYGYTTAISAGANPSTSYFWQQYNFTLGYSFNRTGAALVLTNHAPVYIKCAPQSDGSAIIDPDTPYVQSLPSTEDGKIYIFLGIASGETTVELFATHPVYCYRHGKIQLWTGEDREYQRKPVTVWEVQDVTQGLIALNTNISSSLAWQLTNLDLTPFARIKIYVKAGRKTGSLAADSSITPASIIEMSLDDRAKETVSQNVFIGGSVVQNPNDPNRLGMITCAVSGDKTKFAVLRATTLYGTAATNNTDAYPYVFLIEGYYD